MADISTISFSEIEQFERWDAEFYGLKPKLLNSILEKVGAEELRYFINTAKRGLAPDYNMNGNIPVVRTVNVRDLEFSETRQEFVSKEFVEKSGRGIIGQFDIAITSTGVGTLGRAFCNLFENNYFADGHITILNPKSNTDCSYITAVLQSEVGQIQFERWQRGSSGQIEIYPEDILQVLIPKLPEKLQCKISELWEESVRLVERAKSLYPESEDELLERIGWESIKNVKSDLFFIENNKNFNKVGRFDAGHYFPRFRIIREHLSNIGAVKIEDVCKDFAKGTQPSCYIDNGEVLVVKSKNVFGQGIDFESCERTSNDAYADVSARLTNGDIVINSTGFGTLGRAGFIPSFNGKIVASVDLIILRLEKEILPEYAVLFLNSPLGLMQSEMFQTGSLGQLHLYPQHIKEFLIYLPRNHDDSIDMYFQKRLSDKIIEASVAKQEAKAKLDKAKKLIEEYVNNYFKL